MVIPEDDPGPNTREIGGVALVMALALLANWVTTREPNLVPVACREESATKPLSSDIANTWEIFILAAEEKEMRNAWQKTPARGF